MRRDGERFEAAGRRFFAFFEELRGTFIERDEVLTQVALGLLAREHVLLAGPPGTAKSQIASSVFGRILCEQTGAPSLYARQITESTVHTDLIGPIDFKNLMETGRTSHFTDEGMLGATHAFLDEVFDGRDMLLRSALNVLQERELKQGGTITRGRIECALLTSNRYVSDVLEQSRETLLAFVDRIAFLGFVPRGFADPKNLALVLRRRQAGSGRPSLDALLTLQDLDVLQEAVEDVYVAPEACDAVAQLVERLDAEFAAATRADPTFRSTRYISTRTVVRSVDVLRAIVVLDKVRGQSTRPLSVQPRDLGLLRYNLLLAGPTPDEVRALLLRESDPLERRQLELVRAEREIFDACFDQLEPRAFSERPVTARKPTTGPGEEKSPKDSSAPTESSPPSPSALLEQQIADAASARDIGSVVAILMRLAEATRVAGPDAESARKALERAVNHASALAVSMALSTAEPEASPLFALRRLCEFAIELPDGTASLHSLARWLHDRAKCLVEDVALHVAGAPVSLLESSVETQLALVEQRLDILAELAELRRRLLASSASEGLTPRDEAWDRALDKAEQSLASMSSSFFLKAMATALSSAPASAQERLLGPLLERLGPELERLDRIDRRLNELASKPLRFKALVAGKRLGELIRAALLSGAGADRTQLLRELSSLAEVLRRHDLIGAVRPIDWLAWTAEAVLAHENSPPKTKKKPSREAYLALRGSERRTAVIVVLAEAVLALGLVEPGQPPVGGADGVAHLLALLEPALRAKVIEADLARVERAVALLERWWDAVVSLDDEPLLLTRVFDVLWDDQVLVRWAMETRLIEQLLPDVAEATAVLRQRVERLADQAHARALAVLERRAGGALARLQPDRR